MRMSETLNFKSQFSDPKGNILLLGGPRAVPSIKHHQSTMLFAVGQAFLSAKTPKVQRLQNTWVSLTAEQKLLHRSFVGKHLASA